MSDYSSFPVMAPTGQFEREAARSYDNYVKGIMKYDIATKYVTYVVSGGSMTVPKGAVFNPLDDEYQDLRPWFELTFGTNYNSVNFLDGQSLVDAFNADPKGYGMRPITLKHANAIASASAKANEARKEIDGFAKGTAVFSAKALLNGEQLSKDYLTRFNQVGEFMEQNPTYDCPYFPLRFSNTWIQSPLIGLFHVAFDADAANNWTTRRNIFNEMKTHYLSLKGEEETFHQYIKLGNPTSFDSIGVWHARFHGLLWTKTRDKRSPGYRWGRRITQMALESLAQGTNAVPTDYVYFNIEETSGETINGDQAAGMQIAALQPGSPNAYWYYFLKHRVVVQESLEGRDTGMPTTTVMIHPADMKTGALTGKGRRIATVAGIGSKAIGVVSRYYPNVPTYSQVDNPSVDNKQIQSMYRTEIENSPQLKAWLGTQNKSDYHYAFVLNSTWQPNEMHFVTSDDQLMAQQGYGTWRGMFDQYGKPSDQRLKNYLKKEAFSPHLRSVRGVGQVSSGSKVNYRTGAGHYRDYLGPFNGNATAQNKAKAMWAYSGRSEHKGFIYADYSVDNAIAPLDLPNDMAENIFRGVGSRYNSTLYALAIPNATIEAAKDFMKKRVPVLVSAYLTSASASGNTAIGRFLADNQSFSSMGQNVPIAGLADRRHINTWEDVFSKAIEHYSNSPESLFMSDFKKVLEETVGKWGGNVRYGMDNWEVPYLYGNSYDNYMALLGACAVLSNGQAFLPTIDFPGFLSDGQKSLAQSLLNSYVLKGQSTVISNFMVNDTADVHSIHSFLSGVGALNSMQESPVFDVPAFHIMFKPRGAPGANYVSDPRIQVAIGDKVFRVPGMAIEAFAFEGAGEGDYGQVFHRQIVQTSTLYNNFRISSSSSPNHTPTMTATVRVPINTTGTEGGTYGLTAGRSLSLSQVTLTDGQALKISPSFKLTKGQLLGSSALVYSLILGAGLVKALKRGRYI